MISLVIICRNEAEYIGGCLESIAGAAGDVPCEIVIVDGRSSDGTLARCRAFAAGSGIPVRVVESEPGFARQRNAGVRAARYEWIAFVSADVRVTAGWLHEIAATAGNADLMIGSFDLVPDRGRGAWMASVARSVYPSVCATAVERCSTVNLAARRTLLLEHPFDESVAACEDKDFAARALAGSAAPRAVRLTERPRHLARESFPQWLRKIHQEARALALLSRRRRSFPDCFGWRAHARRASLFALCAALAATARQPLLALVAAAACVGSASVHSARRAEGVSVRHALSMLAITAGTLAGLWRWRESA